MERLLIKYFAGDSTEAEKKELFHAMKRDEELKKTFVKWQNTLAVLWASEQQGDTLFATYKLKDWKKERIRKQRNRFLWKLMKTAAAVALVFGIWTLSQQYTVKFYKEKFTWVEAPKGQRVSVALADGTSVDLNPCTKLKIPNVFEENWREVELEGEAYFKVKSNSGSPFVVKTRKYKVRVTGTEFNVYAYPRSDIFETELVKGTVYVYGNQQEICLNPNEKAFELQGELRKIESVYKQNQLKSEGIFDFTGIPFDQLLKRLELWYDVEFAIKGKSIVGQAYTGKFHQSDKIENILQAIKEVGKFDFKIIDERHIEIY